MTLDAIQEELSYGIGTVGNVEADPRTLPWATLRRLALEAGTFLPPYRPVSGGEIAERLLEGIESNAEAYADPGEGRLVAYWLQRLALGRGGLAWHGCECKQNPPNLRLTGRAEVFQSTFGDVVESEAGRLAARGLVAAVELDADFWAGRWWAGVGGRLLGRIAEGGREAPAALLYTDWPLATGRAPTGWARDSSGAWRVDWPRAVGGVRLGNWSLTAGWSPRMVGPGVTGGLTFSENAPSFPAVTARRTQPFEWSGILDWFDPDHLLMRFGLMSEQRVFWRDEYGIQDKLDQPWHFQWLISWNHTSWLRTTLTHAAMAVPRQGTLWPDLFQINFPLLGATWNELDRGPITDRLFSLLFEARFRRAPWPLLPAAAGRVYWEYAGEDYDNSSLIPIIPQISAPASLVGFELMDPRWDLALEYAWLRHPTVLWYANGGYAEGYAQESWVLGHPLGGSAVAWTGALHWRSRSSAWQLELTGRHATWLLERVRQADARLDQIEVGWRSLARAPAFWLRVGWREEDVEPPAGGAPAREQWWLARIGIEF